ncbi:uncharacterized protein LOC117643036 [Thrips palmi]|uniref:Uncharacterized protein LOC117643036 n=1 Tax=Thrips palmi TaxID=161013 RepID=A0A6P8YKL1_THRPL|nr:uncharacterized protein LOC117643036 [Thrips palmi]
MFECAPQPMLPRPSVVNVSRKTSTAEAAASQPAQQGQDGQQGPRPVLVRLEGRTLSVWSSGPVGDTGSRTAAAPRVPRLALWSEQEASLRRARAALAYRRRYHLHGGAVALRPHGVVGHKQWSRKYPICITATLEDAVFEAPEDVVEAEEEATGKAAGDAAEAVVEEVEEVAVVAGPSLHEVQPLAAASAHVAVVAGSVALGQAPPDPQPSPRPSSSTLTPTARIGVLESQIEAAATEKQAAQGATPDESDLSDEFLDLTDDVEDLETVEECLLGRIVSQELIALTEEDDVEAPATSATAAPLRATASSTSTLLLLARTARQKEEWFWRLRRAVGEKHPLDDEAVFEDYVATLRHYLDDEGDEQGGDGDIPAYRGLNALASRVLFTVCRSARWAGQVRAHLQRRLAAVKIPAFVKQPVVADFFCRPSSVEVDRAAPPRLDAQGLWLDLGVRYRGVTKMVITTRFNLVQQQQPQVQPHTDADEELRHPDEEGLRPDAGAAAARAVPQQQRGAWKIFRRLTESRFFQAALVALSDTDIVLTVELQALEGALVLHVPPPPSDRVWLGFRGVPCLRLVVVPRVGNRTLRQALLCRLIERKLRAQLEKVFVLPNMYNVAVPFMGMAMGEAGLDAQRGSNSTTA